MVLARQIHSQTPRTSPSKSSRRRSGILALLADAWTTCPADRSRSHEQHASGTRSRS
ncbi:MAG: hypothetical protein QOH90_845 [Actinomycetota bacterium]|nr:hypothetical protein [Actinomycetota bacterium]